VEKIPLRGASRCAANIIRVFKSRRMRCPVHVTHTGDRRGAHRVVGGGPEQNRPLGISRRRREDNRTLNIQEVGLN
jgi:hypothetical protein